MSTFTAKSSRQEIPRQFFSTLKSHVFGRLREISTQDGVDWSGIADAIVSPDAAEEEFNAFVENNPSAGSQFQYTVLRAVKTMHHTNSLLQNESRSDTFRLRPDDLKLIDIQSFFVSFFADVARSPDIGESAEAFRKLRPSDRELIAEDIYRKHLYRTAEIIQQRMVIASAEPVSKTVKSSRSRKSASVVPPPSSRASRRPPLGGGSKRSVRPPLPSKSVVARPVIRANDSVSCAPSEIISEKPGDGELNKEILSLHVQQQEAAAAEAAAVPTVASKKSPPTEIGFEIPSNSTHRRTKFSRSPSRRRGTQLSARSKKEEERSCFFDTEVSHRTVLSRSEVQ